MDETRKQQRRKAIEKASFRAKWPAAFKAYCDRIAVRRGLIVFERDGMAWATDGDSEWIFHRPVNPKALWREAWSILHDNPANLDRPN
jgi:hypothetical protein